MVTNCPQRPQSRVYFQPEADIGVRGPVGPFAQFRNIQSLAPLRDNASREPASLVPVTDKLLWAACLEHRHPDLQGVACSRGYWLTAKQYSKPSPPELFSAAGLQPLELWADAQAAKS